MQPEEEVQVPAEEKKEEPAEEPPTGPAIFPRKAFPFAAKLQQTRLPPFAANLLHAAANEKKQQPLLPEGQHKNKIAAANLEAALAVRRNRGPPKAGGEDHGADHQGAEKKEVQRQQPQQRKKMGAKNLEAALAARFNRRERPEQEAEAANSVAAPESKVEQLRNRNRNRDSSSTDQKKNVKVEKFPVGLEAELAARLNKHRTEDAY